MLTPKMQTHSDEARYQCITCTRFISKILSLSFRNLKKHNQITNPLDINDNKNQQVGRAANIYTFSREEYKICKYMLKEFRQSTLHHSIR